MNPIEIIDRYYAGQPELRELLLTHSRAVARKALECAAKRCPDADVAFVEEAALLHDIGILYCDAPGIHCHGSLPYLCHGVEGRRMLEAEGLPLHALVCERHTGSGLRAIDIEQLGLPLPIRDMLPLSIEEKLICYADKFFSKSGDPTREKSLAEARRSIARHGGDALERFDALHALVG